MRNVLTRPVWAAGAAATAAALVVSLAVTPATAAPNNNDSAKLRTAVTVDGVMRHMTALDAIGRANGDNRYAGLPGYDRSVDYVVEELTRAGYAPTTQEFTYLGFREVSAPVLEIAGRALIQDTDFATMTYSGSGDVTGRATAPSGAATGCAPADFTGFPAGQVAVVSRGTCTFRVKATNALAAGAGAVVIYNNAPGPLNGTLGAGDLASGSVVGTTRQIGLTLVATTPLVRVVTRTQGGKLTTRNVLAELPGRSGDTNTVMIGAHLDSVAAGPGINDNGSGSAGILETAIQMAKTKPRNTVRFAWWSAEESGLVGSNHYVDTLTQQQRDKIALYLNFDMIGSPNYARFVYDGDNGTFPVGTGVAAGPAGSAQIEALFEEYFASQGLASEPTPFSGRSDYGRFIAFGIPSGGLFTGAEGIKTPAQAAKFGGTAGVAYDACYHLRCDTIANVNRKAIDEMGDALAHAAISYAQSTTAVNGVRGKGGYRTPAGGASSGSGTGSGGGLHDHEHELDAI